MPSDFQPTLFDYYRSSASYRVRIALNLANIKFESIHVDLPKGEQKSHDHLARNPQGLVPVLDIDGHRFTQSLSIIEYLDTTRGLDFWPKDPVKRAHVNSIIGSIAIDTHPICNISVAKYACGDNMDKYRDWMQHFISKGLEACEVLLSNYPTYQFSVGDIPGIVDICLMPQLYNARRWYVNFEHLNRISAAEKACKLHSAFIKAAP